MSFGKCVRSLFRLLCDLFIRDLKLQSTPECHSQKNTAYPISCCCHVVGCLSAKFLLRREVTATLYQNQKGLQKRLCWLSHGRCDSDMRYYFRELKSPDRWRGRNMIKYGIVKGDYSWRLWNVSAANQIKSRIIPDGKKRETTKYESTNSME